MSLKTALDKRKGALAALAAQSDVIVLTETKLWPGALVSHCL
jgi:hypothetical protein